MDRLRREAREASDTGWTMFAELISAIGVWSAIGFGLDKLFGTSPVLLAIGMVVGHAMAIWIVWWRSGMRARANARDRLTR